MLQNADICLAFLDVLFSKAAFYAVAVLVWLLVANSSCTDAAFAISGVGEYQHIGTHDVRCLTWPLSM